MKALWHWERHDVVNYLREHFLESEVEFTTESLIKKINKSKNSYRFGYGYDDRILSEHLSDLAVEGYLSVRYVSVKMEPNVEYWFGKKWYFGSKTQAVYRMVGRNEKIDSIVK